VHNRENVGGFRENVGGVLGKFFAVFGILGVFGGLDL
jgi:hypothetical protein